MSEDGDVPKPLIIDNGSCVIKSGYGGDEQPCGVFPSCVIYSKQEDILVGRFGYSVGDEACKFRNFTPLKYPISHGIIKDWDDMKKIWGYTFYKELREDPSKHPIMLTEAPFNPKANRENMCKIMFEEYDAPSMYIQIQAVLSLYSAGRTTGIVVDSGDGVTHTVPVFEGYQIPHAIGKIPLAGRDLTDFMVRILKADNYNFEDPDERECVRKIKEKLCYVAEGYEAECKKVVEGSELEKSYILPDGKICKFSKQRFECPELLFQPEIGERKLKSLHQLTFDSIMACDLDVRKDLYANIILSGGTTMFKGFGERLYKEVKELAPNIIKVNVIAGPDRQYAAWRGGSDLSTLSSFAGMWITKNDYDEFGEAVVHRKCF